jgi:16S rRNA C967 or C1407 C5-methylase (RsmB/RsmF family)/NOL1/NOP2/fmu family ribosome biogenesis protein
MLNIPLPEAFVESILKDSPFGQPLIEALNDTPSTSVRINLRKPKVFDFQGNEPVSWCPNAFYLKERPNFTLDPLFHAGAYYPQEAASMAIYDLVKSLNLPQGSVVLDACAAPGGKTLAMIDALPENCAGIANEIHPHRANILCENVTKWGLDNVAVCNNDTSMFRDLPAFFDLVLIDAPCSGEGMFRKDPNARLEWSLASVDKCIERQRVIINNLINGIKPGGYLIYATCTFNENENEKQLQEILATGEFELHPWIAPTDSLPGRNRIGHYFIPGRSRSEGLFIGVLKKCGSLNSNPTFLPSTSNHNFTGLDFDVLPHQELVGHNNLAYLRSSILGQVLSRLKIPLRILKNGLAVAELTAKGWGPQHDLSMITNRITAIDCSKQEALMYLRGETFPVPPYPPGYYLIRFQGVNLGFIKHLGQRFNNLYPKTWRIRMHLK